METTMWGLGFGIWAYLDLGSRFRMHILKASCEELLPLH